MKKKPLALGLRWLVTVNVVVTFLCIQAVFAANHNSGLKTNTHFIAKSIYTTNQIISTTVTGTVTDEKGLPLIGAIVIEQGTKNSTSTDVNGKYKIEVSSPDAILVFTYIGYNAKTERLNNRKVLDVQLEPKSSELSEIIVTALGIKRESKKLGYSAEKVNVDEITTNRTVNFANALEGKVAGLDITPPSAGPGSSTKIRLRGQSSFLGDNSPLIVVDGLPLSQSASSANSYSQSIDYGDNLQQINPDDIESMTVLKGATAAALYGSRALNGAIIITTKSGAKKTGIGVEFTSNLTMDKALDYTDFQYEYGQGENNVRPQTQGQAQSSGAWSFGEKFDGVPTYQFDGVQRPYLPVKNRVSEFFRTAQSARNTIAISGGNERGSFRASYSDQYAQGIVPNNSYHKNIFNVGINYNLTPKLTAQVNINYDHEFNSNPPQVGIQAGSIPQALYRFSNSIDFGVLKAAAIDANGNETPTSRFNTVTNPYWEMAKQFTRQTKDHLLGTASVKYQFFSWLYLQGRVNMDYLVSPLEQNNPTGTLALSPAPAGQYNGTYGTSTATSRQMNMDFLLGGGHKWGDFSFDGTFGGNTFPSYYQSFSESTTNFYIRDLYTIGNGVTTNSSYFVSRQTTNSLYATADFGYKSYLYVNLTGRNDWFSVLSPEHNHYFYPSISGSFVFSEFLKNPPKWLNFGKIRATYAYVGSANGIGAYSNSLTFGLAQNTFNGQPLGSINNGSTPNTALKPYNVQEKEIGLEMHMFNSRVNIDIAAYDKKTTNQILNVVLSSATGYSGSPFNLGGLDNQGLEFGLQLIPVKTKDFTWITNFNTATNKSKVLSLIPGQQQLTVGTGEFFGTLVDQVGLPLNQIQGADYRRDANGNYILAGGKPLASTSPALFGSALPTSTGGWINTFKYKRLSLVAQIDYKSGGKVLSSSNLNWLREGLSQASLVGRVGGVTFTGVSTAGVPNTTAVNAEDFYANYRSQNIIAPFVYSSSFIKLRSLSLSYNLTDVLKSKYIKGLVVSALCHNVLIIKKYIPNLDPEAIQSSGDNLAGYEQGALPTTRTYGLNLNFKF